MSGWIKIEKELLSDPRFITACVTMEARNGVTERDVTALLRNETVTLMLGAVTRLWIMADSHLRYDDVLTLGPAQINKLVGVDGFCEVLPRDWLEILDSNSVKVPNYHGHNGTEPKVRSNNAERQARFRAKQKAFRDQTPLRSVSNGVTHNSVTALDQTRPDQTRPDPQEAPNGASCDSDFEAVKRAYPTFSGRQDWATAEHCCNHLIDRGQATWTELEEGARRYATYTKAALTPPDRVTHPKNFFSLNARDKPWSQPWDPPATKAQVQQDANIDAARVWLAQSESK